MNGRVTGLWALTLVMLPAGIGCASTGSGAKSTAASHSEIPRILERQAAAWNKSDIDGFMFGYWKSADLTFSSGGKLTRGWEPMLALFRESYVDKGTMGKLTFSDLEVTDLGADSAFVLGRWKLEGKAPDSGAFTLIIRRVDGQWVIIHDHTSRDTP